MNGSDVKAHCLFLLNLLVNRNQGANKNMDLFPISVRPMRWAGFHANYITSCFALPKEIGKNGSEKNESGDKLTLTVDLRSGKTIYYLTIFKSVCAWHVYGYV